MNKWLSGAALFADLYMMKRRDIPREIFLQEPLLRTCPKIGSVLIAEPLKMRSRRFPDPPSFLFVERGSNFYHKNSINQIPIGVKVSFIS